jgi:hypothetical protein
LAGASGHDERHEMCHGQNCQNHNGGADRTAHGAAGRRVSWGTEGSGSGNSSLDNNVGRHGCGACALEEAGRDDDLVPAAVEGSPMATFAVGHFTWTPTDTARIGVAKALPLRESYAYGMAASAVANLPSEGTEVAVTTSNGQPGVFRIDLGATPCHAAQIGLWLDTDVYSIAPERIFGCGPRTADPAATSTEGSSNSPLAAQADDAQLHVAAVAAAAQADAVGHHTRIHGSTVCELRSGARLRLVLVASHRGSEALFDPRAGGTACGASAFLTIQQLPVPPGAYRPRSQ